MSSIIPYISPSKFYYWKKCPLKAVYYYKYKHEQFFPRHPDADLGNIMHKFYENKHKWNINNKEEFEKKWKEEIDIINKNYKNNSLQEIYYPVQWHSNYYAVKKQLLSSQLLKPSVKIDEKQKRAKREKWIEDDDKVIAGKIDLLIYDNSGKIVELIDYKTGSIFEKQNGKIKIKSAYKSQMALYAKAVMQKQTKKPSLSLISISGKKHILDCPDEYIENTYKEALKLKETINSNYKNNMNKLANPSAENCFNCEYRRICKAYKKRFLNIRLNEFIDVKGKIKFYGNKIFEIETQNGIHYKIINNHHKPVSKNHETVTVYNLYFPDPEKNVLFTVKNTVIHDE